MAHRGHTNWQAETPLLRQFRAVEGSKQGRHRGPRLVHGNFHSPHAAESRHATLRLARATSTRFCFDVDPTRRPLTLRTPVMPRRRTCNQSGRGECAASRRQPAAPAASFSGALWSMTRRRSRFLAPREPNVFAWVGGSATVDLANWMPVNRRNLAQRRYRPRRLSSPRAPRSQNTLPGLRMPESGSNTAPDAAAWQGRAGRAPRERSQFERADGRFSSVPRPPCSQTREAGGRRKKDAKGRAAGTVASAAAQPRAARARPV